jgi:hypothetical protein
MGRLKLNVLLSFAQFEREVTAERIRDKIAASKKKGMWMGGMVPWGYKVHSDPKIQSLEICEERSSHIRYVYDLYEELGAYLEKFGIKPASALLDMHFEPLRLLYDGLIPAVGLTLLAALPKVGKSWFVLNLAKHIDADGIPVHYLAAEDNERRLKDRVQAVFRGYVQHLTYHAVMSTEEKLPRGAAALSHIELVAKGTKAQCIVIDTVQSILMPSANNKNYDQTVEEYDGLRKLAHRLGIAIVVVHHCKKTSDVSSAPLEKVIGSIGITGTAEVKQCLQCDFAIITIALRYVTRRYSREIEYKFI